MPSLLIDLVGNFPFLVTIIGEEAFKDCTSLQVVQGGVNLVKIQDRAFENTNLKEITIHEYVKQIGIGAFNCNSGIERIAIFKGDDLPQLSYSDSSAALNNQLLKPAFEGNWTAVINSEKLNLSGTIFNNDRLGFIGNIATKDNSDALRVFSTKKYVTNSKNNLVIDSSVTGWSNDKISVEFNASGEYHLNVENKSKTEVEDSFKRIYGNTLPAMKVFEMTLTDSTDTVKLSKLGKMPLTISVPLPTEIKGNTIHVVVMDENGQLEKLSSSLETKDGKNYVRFSTNYLSTFAIYAMGENGTLQIENGAALSAISGKKDYSPNTGDNSIHPKWFVATGISALAIAFMAYKPKKRKK